MASLAVKELKDAFRLHGSPASGRKELLVARIVTHFESIDGVIAEENLVNEMHDENDGFVI